MLDVIRHAADFERVLALPACARSRHFSFHHLGRKPLKHGLKPELSTGAAPTGDIPVDDLPATCWLGSVVPKRHARRAATRNLLKRQIRHCLARYGDSLAPGLWVVRLKAGFDREQFTSAQSSLLREAASAELQTVLVRLVSVRARP